MSIAPGPGPDIDANAAKRIGMLTPSSNTVLEPLTARMALPLLPDVSVHFGRFKVTEISMSTQAQKQFDLEPIMTAAGLLADAKVDTIAWNGTSAGWLGFDTDEALCAKITSETGVKATTTMLSLNEVFAGLDAKRIALVTPYLSEIQEPMIANYERLGFEVVGDRRLEDRGNFSFACYSSAFIARMVREAALSRPDAIAVICTNFRGAECVAELEEETGIPIIDSVAVTLWGTLRQIGVSPNRVTGWGRMFQQLA